MKTFKALFMLASLLSASMLAAQSTNPDTVCVNATGVKYFVTNTVGSTYAWTITGGGTIASGNGTNEITVDWNGTTGTDTVKVIETNAEGCVGDEQKLPVTRMGIPIANAGFDETIGACGQTALLDASGSTGSGTLSYSWSPAGSLSDASIANPVASPAVTTTYTVTVTSSHGCSSTDDVTVTVEPAPVADAGTDTVIGACAGQSVTLDATASTGNGLSYSWSPAAGLNDNAIANPVATPASTTTYTLTITDDNGCTSTDQVTVTVDNAPVADAGSNDTIGSCAGQSATLNATASTGTNLSYSWSPAASLNDASIADPVATPGSTTTYTLTITDDYGCSSTDQVTVTVDPAPVADAGSDIDICAGGSATLDASGSTGSGLSYSWSPSASLSDASIANPVASPADTTTYTLTVTDAHGCTSISTVTVNVIPNATADAGADADVCEGNTYTLSGTATDYTTVVWSTSGDGTFTGGTSLTPDYKPGPNDISNGTVTLTLTANSGGTCPATTDDIVITIDPKPATSPIYHY